MNAKEIIESLSVALKVPVEVMWAALIKQAYVNLIEVTLFLLVMSAAAYGMWRWLKRIGVQENRRSDDLYFPFYICAIVLAIPAFIAVVSFISGIGGALNPEYYAVNKILSTIKGN